MRLIAIYIIFSMFNLHSLDSNDNKVEEDKKAQIVIINELKNFVENKFQDFYKDYNITITNLSIKPAIDTKLNKMVIDSIKFDDKLLRTNSGNFEVILKHNEKKQRVFFTFDINASIDVLIASSSIKTNEVLSNVNTENSKMQISKIIQLPSKNNVLDNYQAKSFITIGSVIINSKITPKIIVNKGDLINTKYKSNGIEIVFDAKASENGALNQEIKAQSVQGNKDIKIKIISSKEAILQ